MPASVFHDVYFRTAPDVNATRLGYHPTGSTIELKRMFLGTSIQGNSVWYEKTDGSAVWSGAVNDPKIDWGLKAMGIPEIWLEQQTKGEGIRVAVIDSGIVTNNDLVVASGNCKNVLDNSQDVTDRLIGFGHGTGCAGIVAARGNMLFGVAPACQLVIIKITDEDLDGITDDNLVLALREADRLNVDVISISLELPFSNESTKSVINDLMNKGIIVIAAAGNIPSNHVQYPANYPGVISVNSAGLKEKQAVSGMEEIIIHPVSTNGPNDANNEGITVVAPGGAVKIYSNTGEIVESSGTSYAAPFVAGVACLWLSKFKNKIAKSRLHNAFRKAIIQTTGHTGEPDPVWGQGLIKPLLLFKQ